MNLLVFGRNTWNHLTVCKQMTSDLYENVTYKLYLAISVSFKTINREEDILRIFQKLLLKPPIKGF